MQKILSMIKYKNPITKNKKKTKNVKNVKNRKKPKKSL
jgi:hypothetical protein